MKNFLLLTLSLGSLFCNSLSVQTFNDGLTEEEIVARDFDRNFDKEHDGISLINRVHELLRKAKFLENRCEFGEMESCYQEAAGLLGELSKEETAYGHLSADLIQGLCLNRCRIKDQSLIKGCFKKTYEIYLTHEFKVKDEFDYWIIVQGLHQAQFAAYLAEDYEAFAQLIYKQMDLADPFMFTYYIYEMEEFQLLAHQEFKKDHWIFGKMQSQMEQKILKDIEIDVRLKNIRYCGLLIDFYKSHYTLSVKDIVDRLENSLAKNEQ